MGLVDFDINAIIAVKDLHGKNGSRKMTVGKIYAGLLILENYRSYKLSLKLYGESRPVSFFR